MDKAKINAAVKEIKKIRAESANKDAGQQKKLAFQVSSKPEKAFIGLGLAAGMAIILDDAKKRKKNPKKARPFYRRCIDNYKMIDSLLDSTIAKQLKKDSEREFHDEKLENMQIENALKFKL